MADEWPWDEFVWPRFVVYPCCNGGIQLECDNAKRHFEVEFNPDGQVSILTDDDGKMQVSGLKSLTGQRLLRLVEWVMGGEDDGT